MQAQPSKDSLQISLLTASPGSEVYEKYGHTALRVKELHGRYDVIFNYGLFSFDAPNFLYRFVKGETDYQLGATRPEYFIPEYVLRGSDLTEQILNLNQQEATDVLNALQENLKPENRVYRYSFIFDNCSTRPRDIVAANIPGGVEYKTENIDKTFRDLLHRQTGPRTWLTFGIDLTLGARTYGKPTFEPRMFLPE